MLYRNLLLDSSTAVTLCSMLRLKGRKISADGDHSGSPRPQPGANAVAVVAHLSNTSFSSFCTVCIFAGGVLSLTYIRFYSHRVH